MKKLVILAALMFCACIVMQAQEFQSKHFIIQKLADGVYTAIAKNGGYAICNAGIIDLGDATLIFDPFMTPEAAEDLKKVSFELTNHAVKYVVNSHFHNDHIGGDQVFPDASLISTQRTRELIEEYQPQEIADDKKNASVTAQKVKEENTSGYTGHQLEEHTMWLGYYEALATSSDSLKIVLPNITFSDSLIIHGTKRQVKLITYGEGHTESDLFLYLPNEHIAFLGDLLFIKNQPWVGDGDVDKWKLYLDSIAKLNLEIVVPGHGPVGKPSDIAFMKLYFQNIDDVAREYQRKRINPRDDTTLTPPKPFSDWFLSNFYKPNVISEYNRLDKK